MNLHYSAVDVYHWDATAQKSSNKHSVTFTHFHNFSLQSSDIYRSHGVSRPTLAKQVASNSDELVEEATKDAFAHYASNPDEIKTILEKLAKPLKGVGPAAASLLLAIHDPDNIIFFSDEVYQWLVAGEKKVSLKYSSAEYEEIFTKGKELQTRLKVSPIDIEKVAYVLIKENEPAAPAKKESTGRGRGRPPKPESEKKAKKPTVPGRGRGRPPGSGVSKPKATKAKAATNGTGKGRGRPAKAKADAEKKDDEEDEDEDEDEDEEKEEVKTPAGKRKAKDDGSAKRSGKKAKA